MKFTLNLLRQFQVLFVLGLALLSFQVNAQVGTIVTSGGTATVPDSSCLSVATTLTAGLGASNTAVGACSTDPVGVGTVLVIYVAGVPSSTTWTVSSISATPSVGGADAIDYTVLSQVWGFAFVSVLSLYFVAKNAGLVLSVIRGR